MELKSTGEKLKKIAHKYRYAGLVLLLGIALMWLPAKEDSAQQVSPVKTEEQPAAGTELEEILSTIEGAGKVRVLLTIANGEETIYQVDQSVSGSSETGSTQYTTITVTDANRNQNGLIRQVKPPVYQGAIVVAQGADSAAVRFAIVNAVSNATGLSTDRISVLKMK